MQSIRVFVLASLRSTKVLAVLECTSLTTQQAKVPADVNLDGIKPGMIVRPALSPREPDPDKAYTIQDVQQAKTGQSTIRFQPPEEKASAPSKVTPPEAEQK